MIRVLNVDAPELNQAFGLKAKDSLTNLIQDKTISIAVLKTDLYGRLLAKVSFQGRALDSLLVANGWAWCYAKYNRNEMLPELQQMAVQSAKGLWQSQQAIPP
jgi:endonuclease YncB( thermonuclease family)